MNDRIGIAAQKDIFRLAAAIYSVDPNAFSESETQLEIIKCILASTGNSCLTCSEIAAQVLETYKYHLSEDEVKAIIRNSNRSFEKAVLDAEDAYKLTDKEYQENIQSQDSNIDHFIDAYAKEKQLKNPTAFKNAVHMYLYELTTTNINSYRVLLSGKDGTQFSSGELSVDLDELTEEERQYIHDFLDWDNPKKNEVLGSLVFCCLEYCLLISGDNPNSIVAKLIRQRDIYLDTNVIFRALGINGDGRMKVMRAFLDKCKQANIRIIISGVTKKEFFDTIGHYVSQIIRYPRGVLYDDAYEQICDYNIFTFYEKWKFDHQTLSLTHFNMHIEGLYNRFIKEYGIEDDERIPGKIYSSPEFNRAKDNYATSIGATKQSIRDYYLIEDYSGTARYRHDATIVKYIEIQKETCPKNKDIFLVSSDKLLRAWDMNRPGTKYPVVIYPSQLFLILLKTCGRSKNDFDSFVSFINIRPKSKQISPEKANIILSGISSITEDIVKQREIVEAMFEGDFQNVLKRSNNNDDLYANTQNESKKYLENVLKEKEARISELTKDIENAENDKKQLKTASKQSQEELKRIKQNKRKDDARLKEQEKRIDALAEKHIMLRYVFRCYIVPFILVGCCLACVLFIVFQFVCVEKEWNFVVLFFEWIKGTYFGKTVGDFVYVIDAALLTALGLCLKKWMINPFKKDTKQRIKKEMMERFICSIEITK